MTDDFNDVTGMRNDLVCLIFRGTHKTEPLTLIIGDHHELVCFHLYSSTQHSLVLGLPWLKEHNPHIDWSTGGF